MSEKFHKQPQPALDREALKKMVELELQQLAVRVHEEHGVEIATAAHMLFPDDTGSFLAVYSHDDPTRGIFNFLWMAVSCVGLVRDMGVPLEVIGDFMSRYDDDGEAVFSAIQRALDS